MEKKRRKSKREGLEADTSHREISADLPEKERQGKKGKWRSKEQKSKREGGKLGGKLKMKGGSYKIF